jgi:SOS-response transcriptional repressor LexA
MVSCSDPLDFPARMGLTPKQQACLDAIKVHFAKTGTMPSVENLRRALGFGSKTGIIRLLRQLEERGRIARLPHRARAIRLLDEEMCPHCGERLPREALAA